MTTRYTSLEQFSKAKVQAHAAREVHATSIGHRWALLKQPEKRGALLRDAMGDVLRSWKPYRHVHELLNGHISGSTVSAVGMAVASMQKGLGKRLLFSGISMLLGKVIGEKEDKGPGLLSTLATAIGSMRQRMRERKAEREEEEVEVDLATEPTTRD
ncbi:MAG: hypothetical protein IPG92_00530 [Flavobacteriales bacterium]|nr:hypothetical protein [Flavobacteriales bacterium]